MDHFDISKFAYKAAVAALSSVKDKSYSSTVKKYLFMLELRGVTPTLLNLISNLECGGKVRDPSKREGCCKKYGEALRNFVESGTIPGGKFKAEEVLLIQILSIIAEKNNCQMRNIKGLLNGIINRLIEDFQFNLKVYSEIKPFLEELSRISEALEKIEGLRNG